MIFLSRKLIYLHLQKTGGNSISTSLLPFSDDEKRIKPNQDGIDRFGLTKTEYTLKKHAKLADYSASLGDRINQFKVAISLRDPLDRAVSMYYSPHRWMEKSDQGVWSAKKPFWSGDMFEEVLSKMFSVADFLRVGDRIVTPDHVIWFDDIREDFGALCTAYNFPISGDDLYHVNKTAANCELKNDALASTWVKRKAQERFREDYDLIERLRSSD
jgi:hypothetical protein